MLHVCLQGEQCDFFKWVDEVSHSPGGGVGGATAGATACAAGAGGMDESGMTGGYGVMASNAAAGNQPSTNPGKHLARLVVLPWHS